MRLRLSGKYKVVLWIVALFLLWRTLIHVNIVEPLFLFLTAGLVPGTDVKLTPDTILTALPFVFIGIVVLIFHREFWRLIRAVVAAFSGKSSGKPLDAQMVSLDAQDVRHKVTQTPESVKVVAPGQHLSFPIKEAWFAMLRYLSGATARVRRQVSAVPLPACCKGFVMRVTTFLGPALSYVKRRVRTLTYAFVARLIPLLHKAAYKLGVVLGWTRYHTDVVMMQAKQVARFAAKVIRIESRNAARYIKRTSIRLWKWLSPYLWQIDAWLGVRLNALLNSPYIYHAKQIVRDITQELARFFRNK